MPSYRLFYSVKDTWVLLAIFPFFLVSLGPCASSFDFFQWSLKESPPLSLSLILFLISWLYLNAAPLSFTYFHGVLPRSGSSYARTSLYTRVFGLGLWEHFEFIPWGFFFYHKVWSRLCSFRLRICFGEKFAHTCGSTLAKPRGLRINQKTAIGRTDKDLFPKWCVHKADKGGAIVVQTKGASTHFEWVVWCILLFWSLWWPVLRWCVGFS